MVSLSEVLRPKLWKKSTWPRQSPTAALFTHRGFYTQTFFCTQTQTFFTHTHTFLDFPRLKQFVCQHFSCAEKHVCFFFKREKNLISWHQRHDGWNKTVRKYLFGFFNHWNKKTSSNLIVSFLSFFFLCPVCVWNGLRAKTSVNKNLCLQRNQKNSGFG